MLVLIDESGDAGFKLARGSTQHFIVAMVIFDDFKEAERASDIIEAARTTLRIRTEFKFNKCSGQVKDGFFAMVAPCKFTVRAIVVDKAKIYSENLREHKEMFYNFFVKSLLQHDHNALVGARVKIDGSGDREFKRELAAYLKRESTGGKIVSVKFVESHRDNLIQLADMVAGAIARSYRVDDRNEPDRWRKMLNNKVRNVWNFS
ncbi:MAG: Protein of unknown function (DUF3800) [Candidatus Nitrotoga sp. LAW]|nr:MAG: Protein of unknown function (DUF3800) [Candidatus Nitrotoga sp. LAW]